MYDIILKIVGHIFMTIISCIFDCSPKSNNMLVYIIWYIVNYIQVYLYYLLVEIQYSSYIIIIITWGFSLQIKYSRDEVFIPYVIIFTSIYFKVTN